MTYRGSPAQMAMEWERQFPHRVKIKKYKQAVKDGRAPKRFPELAHNSRVIYRNVGGDFTLEVGFMTVEDVMAFANKWNPDQIKVGRFKVVQGGRK